MCLRASCVMLGICSVFVFDYNMKTVVEVNQPNVQNGVVQSASALNRFFLKVKAKATDQNDGKLIQA